MRVTHLLNCYLWIVAVSFNAQTAKSAEIEIIAHRGASFDAPENTLAAVKLAWKQNADAVEFDVQLSRDGQIVLMHDFDTKRTTGQVGVVAQQDWSQLKKLDAGSWKDAKFAGEKIPLLSEVLATVPAGKRVYIEVKCPPAITTELKKVIEGSKLEPSQTVIICFSEEVVAAVKKEMPNVPAYWLADTKVNSQPPWTAERLIAGAQKANADGVDLRAGSVVTKQLVQQLNKAKLPVCVWTVNDPLLAKQMIEAGVIGITTDRPQWMHEQLKK
ncbi:MAG: glycerophosphodiester phosphodiesterase [Planctomycetota bacterium]|nr:glycerophosphodiester phosphodiesterase [Planctomycetota bacterium]